MQNESKKIYLHTLKTPVYFQLGAFSGFLAKYVFKLDGFDNILIGLNPMYIKTDKRLPGLGVLIKILREDDNTGKKLVSKQYTGELKDNTIVSFNVSREVWDLFLNLVEDDRQDSNR